MRKKIHKIKQSLTRQISNNILTCIETLKRLQDDIFVLQNQDLIDQKGFKNDDSMNFDGIYLINQSKNGNPKLK